MKSTIPHIGEVKRNIHISLANRLSSALSAAHFIHLILVLLKPPGPSFAYSVKFLKHLHDLCILDEPTDDRTAETLIGPVKVFGEFSDA